MFFQNKFVMHVLYFLLKKLMEPPFSEYLVLLKNRVTFSYLFIEAFNAYFGLFLSIFDTLWSLEPLLANFGALCGKFDTFYLKNR
jgi:hypothetical protein